MNHDLYVSVIIFGGVMGVCCIALAIVYCILKYIEYSQRVEQPENTTEVSVIPDSVKPIIYSIPTFISIDQDYNSNNLPIASQV
jgi:hypothetical protein